MAHGAHGGGAGLPTKPKVPPEMAAFLSARLEQEDLPEIDAALAKDEEAKGLGALSQNLSRAAALYRGERVGPMAVPVPDALRQFVTRKQAEAATRPEMTAPNPDDDPASPVSQAARAALLQTPHGQAVRDSLGDAFEQLPASKLKPLLPMWRASADVKPEARTKPADAPPDEVDVAELTKRGIPAGLAKTHGEALDLIGRADAAKAARGNRDADDSARSKRETVQAAIDLRKEFQALPVVKDTALTAQAYQKIQGTSPTGPGDISLIFAFMKMIDPASTVREGEFATAESAGGVPSRIWGLYNKTVEGQKLPESVRQQFRSEAKSLYDAQRKRYDASAAQYRRLAQQAGLRPEDVVLDVFGGSEPAKPAAPDLIGEAAALEGKGRRVVERRKAKDGRILVKYDDGSIGVEGQ
jgi:hypothetical protein